MKWYWKVFMFVGLFLAYLKTAEAMTAFSPHEILGFKDDSLPYIWGWLAAALVEGLALLAFENLIKVTKDTPTRTVSAILVGTTVLFSVAMNLIDQAINDHTFTGGTGTPLGATLYQVMGLIPILAAILLGALRLVDSYFPDRGQNQGGGKQNQHQNQSNSNQSQYGPDRYTDVTVHEPGPRLPQNRPQVQAPNGTKPAAVPENADPFKDLMVARRNGNGGHAFGNDLEQGPRLLDDRNPTNNNPTDPI